MLNLSARMARPEFLIGVLIATLCGWAAYDVVRSMRSVFFYQMFTPEVLLAACGRGFQHPQTLSPEMVQFLLNRTLAVFDCSSIPFDQPLGPPGFFHTTQPYLGFIAAGLWRMLGLTQMSIAPLAVVLATAYGAGGFALARLFLPWPLAAAAGLVIALSPAALTQVFFLRDFSKGPFFLWALVLVIAALRIRPGWPVICLTAGAGVVAGLGYGFRTDLALMLPLGASLILIAGWGHIVSRLGAAGGFIAAFLLAASPVFLQGPGSSGGSLAIQGATEPFRAFALLSPAPYALGHAYSDELTLSAIAAVERPLRPDWDAKEGTPGYQPSQAITLSTQHLLRWAPLFAADFMTQALKSAAWLAGYPAIVAASRQQDPGGPQRLLINAVMRQEPVYALFAQPWMPFLGLAGVLSWLLLVAARSGREAIGLGFLLLVLLTYPGIQFSLRHFFHLEFIWIIGVLSLPLVVWNWKVALPILPRFGAACGVVFGGLAVLYLGLAQFQQRMLHNAITELLAEPRTPTTTERIPQASGAALWRVPVPAAGQALVDAPLDSMTVRLPEVGIQHDVRAHAERFVLTIDGANCPAASASLGLRYVHRPEVWQRLDSEVTAAPGTTVIFPAFYRRTQHFEGVIVPSSHAECRLSIAAASFSGKLPSVMTMVLPPNWQALPLRKGIGKFNIHSKQQ